MIKKSKITKEIKMHESNFDYYDKVGELRKQNARVKYLRQCLWFIAEFPTDKFINKEVKRLRKRIFLCDKELDKIERDGYLESLNFKVKSLKSDIRKSNKNIKTLLFIQDKK